MDPDAPIAVKSIDIRILREDHKLADFCCGNKDIDEFIQEEAWDFQNERLGVSYVFSYKGVTVGFVTLSMADLKKEKMEKEEL